MIECMLQAEMDVHLSEDGADGRPGHGNRRGEGSHRGDPRARQRGDAVGRRERQYRNRRNGDFGAKTVQGEPGRMTIETPRDRNGTFEPLLIPEYERQAWPASTRRSWPCTPRA